MARTIIDLFALVGARVRPGIAYATGYPAISWWQRPVTVVDPKRLVLFTLSVTEGSGVEGSRGAVTVGRDHDGTYKGRINLNPESDRL